jgi:hypothetical protein
MGFSRISLGPAMEILTIHYISSVDIHFHHFDTNCSQSLAFLLSNSTKLSNTAQVLPRNSWSAIGRLEFCRDGSINPCVKFVTQFSQAGEAPKNA